MSTEIEAKFIVPDKGAYDRVRALERLGSYSLLETRAQEVHDDYLDTPERALLTAGYACRRRARPGGIVMTVKSVAGPRDEVHRREELEVSLPPSTPPGIPPSAWPASPARDKVEELSRGKPLQELFHLTQNRVAREVVDADRLVAIASLDTVNLSVGGSSQRWWELELELAEGGTETDLIAMGGWIRATLGLNPSLTSKFERALEAANRAGPGEPVPGRRRGVRPAERSVVLDAPSDRAGQLPLTELAGLGYAARLRRRVTDQVAFYDTHDGAFMKKGYTVTWARSSGTWRLREDGEVVAEEAGPQSPFPLEGAIGVALGAIPAAHPTIPLLEASLVQSDLTLTGIASDPLRLSAREWTFRSPLHPVPPRTLLRLAVSGPTSTLEYFSLLLQERLGFHVSRISLLEQGLALLGLAAPGATAPRELRAGPEDSVAGVCRKIFRGEAWRMRGNATGAIRDLDPEFVHDLRVATRRARSASRLFASLLEAGELQGLRDELRWIARLLGAVRDLDVLTARMETQLALTGSPASVSDQVREGIRSRRARALAELIPALESDRFSRLLALLESAGERLSPGFEAQGQQPAGSFARKRIDQGFRKLSPWFDRPADALGDAELHRIRILFKRLRYACEFFRPLLGEAAESLIASFVSFQDCLGLHQDATTAIRVFTELLGQVPAQDRTEDLLLSMGSLMQVQRDIQQAQRQKFSRHWESASQLLSSWKRLRASGGAIA